MSRLVECVPNFSEGRDRAVIDAIAQAISGVTGVRLLDVDPGADTNRTVYTFVGPPEAVSDAALAAARRAAALIDLSRHTGAHPRIGALDVCPIVPVSDVTMEECAEVARALGRRIAEALEIPVYFYEHAASSPARQSLADIRAGEYEGLARKLEDPVWAPDAGPARFDPRLGATVVGAREFLIAYNVNLNTRDRRLAQEIALAIREAGRLKRDAQGQPVPGADGVPLKVPGRLKAVRAIGWYIDAYRQAQVSINLLSFRTTPLHEVFETVCEEAARLGLRVTGSELVGMVPLEPIVEAGRFYLRKQKKSPGAPERELVEMAVRSLGLDQLGPFDPAKKVIEYAVQTPPPLMSLPVDRFVDEVSNESPAPGGGSVAALSGSLAAALAAMVANVTVGKAGYEAVWDPMAALAERAQRVKAALARAVDEDTQAFNGVIEANRLPKATPEQQAARAAAIDRAYQHAADVPLASARLCLEALELVRDAA
ncbi:MAG: glutamate formimidoyltransferase, partial [Acidobacteriota bacterium]|nr:glutamate formimidoyltransferase [Acidobacteriota bacterium]